LPLGPVRALPLGPVLALPPAAAEFVGAVGDAAGASDVVGAGGGVDMVVIAGGGATEEDSTGAAAGIFRGAVKVVSADVVVAAVSGVMVALEPEAMLIRVSVEKTLSSLSTQTTTAGLVGAAVTVVYSVTVSVAISFLICSCRRPCPSSCQQIPFL
jgi:hypothetical protein